ncbi:unnamed protein product [Linum trigynum]|uniref:Uncharacterized protein n=1 Tax=Linum trigynum TaxID=586398 RepID=A0AAV2FQP5_9ROSI
MTSDDEYHEARAQVCSYGEGKRRKVNARASVDGEEVDQLEEFEEEEIKDEEEEGEAATTEGSQHTKAPPQPPQQASGEGSHHSSYRGSEESDHVRPNLSDEEGGDLDDDAPHYDPTCDHKDLRFVCKMKFASAEHFKDAVVWHAVTAGVCLRQGGR